MDEIDKIYTGDYVESKNVSDFVKHGVKPGKSGRETRFGKLKSR